jgi:uncharacterized membrane protein
MTDRLGYGAVEDRTMPTVAYILYLLGPANGLTVLIGLVVAYAGRGSASAKMRTHLTFLIRTFWIFLAWCVVGGLILAVGIPLSLVLIGIPMVALGGLILAAAGVLLFVRSVVGVIYLARDEAYPRPYALLV